MKTSSAERLLRTIAVTALLVTAGATPALRGEDAYTPCRIRQRYPMLFPQRALAEGVMRGEAVLLLDVDRWGQLNDLLVVAYTRREFADTAVEAVRDWKFTPGYLGGKPVDTTITFVAQFELNGVLAYVRPISSAAADEAEFAGRYAYRPIRVEELDALPRPIEQEAPIYTREWIRERRSGTVRIDFFIDEQGRVRFPRVIEQSDEKLASAALAALQQWRFAPPLFRNRPALVRAQQAFEFCPPIAAAGPPATPGRRQP